MNGHSAEEKIKILYEDSLREIRELAQKLDETGKTVAAAANLISERERVLRTENEKLLVGAVIEVKKSVDQIIGVQQDINKAAVSAALELLQSKGGPINQIDNLVIKQREALGWINRAAQFYEHAYITRPIFWAVVIGGLCGGLAGGAASMLLSRIAGS